MIDKQHLLVATGSVAIWETDMTQGLILCYGWSQVHGHLNLGEVTFSLSGVCCIHLLFARWLLEFLGKEELGSWQFHSWFPSLALHTYASKLAWIWTGIMQEAWTACQKGHVRQISLHAISSQNYSRILLDINIVMTAGCIYTSKHCWVLGTDLEGKTATVDYSALTLFVFLWVLLWMGSHLVLWAGCPLECGVQKGNS